LEKAIIHLNFEHTESGKGRGEKVSITPLAINKNEFAVNFGGIDVGRGIKKRRRAEALLLR
jgi:hypothetical protein